jgi:hypothetical protein
LFFYPQIINFKRIFMDFPLQTIQLLGSIKIGNPRSQVFSPRKSQLPGDAEKKGAAEKLLRFRDLINETAREPSSSKRDVNVEPSSSHEDRFW